MVPRHPLLIWFFFYFASGFLGFLNANPNVKNLTFTEKEKNSDEKLKLSYLCFRKDNMPTHMMGYFTQKESKTDNLLYVEDILNDRNDTLEYFLSFATNEQIWGTDDQQIVESKLQLDAYLETNSEDFLMKKVFFEINQQIDDSRKLNEIDRNGNKPNNHVPEKSFSPTSKIRMFTTKSMPVLKATDQSDATSLATYFLIIGGICLAVNFLKKAFS